MVKTVGYKLSKVGIAIIAVSVVLLAAISWLAWDSLSNSSENTSQISPKNNSKPDKIDTSIHEVRLDLQTAENISILPEYTPESFRAYILDILQNNHLKHDRFDGAGAIIQYQIRKISQVNIVGGQVRINENNEPYPGREPLIWVLTPEGTWDQESLNGPACKSKNGGLIYEEFVPDCYTGITTNSWLKNPNGSIKSLAQ